MFKDDFKPLSNIYGISGTSYLIQLGMIHNKWVIVLLKAKDILDYHIFKDVDVDKLPERDRIVNWILMTIPLDINPQHVIRTVIILLKEAVENKEKKKQIVSIEDCIKSKEKLKKIEEAELKRPMNLGGVIQGKPHQAVAENLLNIISETTENLKRVIAVLNKQVIDIKDLKTNF